MVCLACIQYFDSTGLFALSEILSPNKLRHTVDLGAWLMAPANDGTGRSAIVAQCVAHLFGIFYLFIYFLTDG